MLGQMRGRQLSKSSAAPTDLLVCFPTRANLSLLPKPICSPARLPLPEPNSHGRHSLPSALPPRRHVKKSGTTTRRGQTSPVLWAKTTKQMGSGSVVSEPTSPKVTCAGQIKVKPRIGGIQGSGGCRSWQSVMEEIEKIHGNRKNMRRPDRARRESSGFISKEIMQFLTCLRNVRLSFRCFGAFPGSGTVSNDDDEDEDGENGAEEEEEEWEDNSKAVFSNWFVVLQERKEAEAKTHQPELGRKRRGGQSWDDGAFAEAETAAPPPNALLLMRCRSAPAKSSLEAVNEEEEGGAERNEVGEEEKWKVDEGKKKLRLLIDEEKREEEEERKKQQGMLMEAYGTDHCKISSEIVKETWVLGGIRETLPRSWSSKS